MERQPPRLGRDRRAREPAAVRRAARPDSGGPGNAVAGYRLRVGLCRRPGRRARSGGHGRRHRAGAARDRPRADPPRYLPRGRDGCTTPPPLAVGRRHVGQRLPVRGRPQMRSPRRRACSCGGGAAAPTFAEPERDEGTALHLAMESLVDEPADGGYAPYALSSPGGLERMLDPAGLRLVTSGEVALAWAYPDTDTTVRALLASAGGRGRAASPANRASATRSSQRSNSSETAPARSRSGTSSATWSESRPDLARHRRRTVPPPWRAARTARGRRSPARSPSCGSSGTPAAARA